MAGYRQIHTQIWKDQWFIDLESDEKLLFIYLFSNDLASIAGLYKIPVRVIANETSLEYEYVVQALAKFHAAGKIFYQDGVLWVINMSKYHKNASPFTQQKIAADVANIPDCETKRQYLHCVDTASKPVKAVSTLARESGSGSLSEIEIESGSGSEDVPPPATAEIPEQGPEQDPTPRPTIFKLYESEIGPLTPMIADALKAAEKDYPADWLSMAFREAADHNKRSWKYAEAILKRWKVEGFAMNGKKDGLGPPKINLPAPRLLCGDGDKLKRRAESLNGSPNFGNALREYQDHLRTCRLCSGASNADSVQEQIKAMAKEKRMK
jgi:DnaD/phage-associated family protein